MSKTKYYILSIIILSVTLSINGYTWFVANATCTAFDPNPCDDDEVKGASISLGTLIVEGAGYLLKSNSNYQAFLEIVELSGTRETNREVLLNTLSDVAFQMESANEIYYQMLDVTKSLKYDTDILNKLHTFDYEGFLAEQGLNSTVFDKVTTLLREGDVRGCYNFIYNKTLDMKSRLTAIITDVSINMIPDIPSCWRLNQTFQETLLFGQYITEVFYALE